MSFKFALQIDKNRYIFGMFDLEPHEKEGLIYILGVPALIALIMIIAFLTHVVLNP
ncbi:MAG: hypothetical protein GTO02_09485 [Candidatus Dadabacteria bacterium]|nr:hypothetical protein [Candidatus Dadabacteria bacterium]NIQ14613.1 hypothetical protein [Candidatus Dadabacteria bacterium]